MSRESTKLIDLYESGIEEIKNSIPRQLVLLNKYKALKIGDKGYRTVSVKYSTQKNKILLTILRKQYKTNRIEEKKKLMEKLEKEGLDRSVKTERKRYKDMVKRLPELESKLLETKARFVYEMKHGGMEIGNNDRPRFA
jgi:hypothetical protein